MSQLTDTRAFAHYPTAAIAGAAFLMMLVRWGSLNALQQDRRRSFWRRWLGAPLASADTIGRVFTRIQTEPLRDVLHALYDRLKRNKALGPSRGHDVLILDGHESSASFRRCCPGCLKRRLSDGRIQYYHRLVLAMVSGQRLPFLLDLEPQRPGEDEVGCAMRLMGRLLTAYPRAFDLVLADGLYLRAPFVSLLRRHHKHVLLVLKDERRDLLQDARGIFQGQVPEVFDDHPVTRRIWDVEDLTTWSSLGEPVRVVRSLEHRTVVRQQDGRSETIPAEWIWMTTLPRARTSGLQVARLGHDRWEIENRGFREMTTDWHADHVYRHHPRAIEAFWLMIMLTINLFRAFWNLNLKPVLRQRHTQAYFVRRMAAELLALGSSP